MMQCVTPQASRRRRHPCASLLAVALLVGLSLPAMAAQPAVTTGAAANAAPDKALTTAVPLWSSDNDAWRFTGGPYLWGAGIRGNVGHRSTGTAFMKSDFADIARNLDVAVMGMGEARRGPYSVLADLMYIETTTRNGLPAGAPASRLEVDSKSASGFLGGGYTVLGNKTARLDVAGGVRVWYSDTTLSLHGGPVDGASGSDRATWADALAGLRGKMAVSDRLWLSSWGMAGAGQSRADWDVAALAGWDFLPGFSAVAGYRAMGVDYRHNGFVYDIIQQGPLLGISGSF